MVVNTIKSRLGGYGTGGLMEGEPRNDGGAAWATYTSWIDSGVLKAATKPSGHSAGYVVEWRIGWEAVHVGTAGALVPRLATQDVPLGLNLAFGDVRRRPAVAIRCDCLLRLPLPLSCSIPGACRSARTTTIVRVEGGAFSVCVCRVRRAGAGPRTARAF